MIKHKSIGLAIALSLFTSIACAGTFSKSHEQKVDKLFEVVHFDQMIENQVDLITKTLTKQPQFAGHEKEFKQLFARMLNNKELKKEMKLAYLKTFTEQEVEQMIEFNQSPVGQKVLAKLPQLTEELMTNVHERIAANQQELQQLIIKIALEQAKENG